MKNYLTDLEDLIEIRKQLKISGKKVVFTNGCFDIIHAGHVDYLVKAKSFGDVLIVGLNSDASVKKIKGDNRPIIPELERAFVLYNLKPVDYVVLFDEETPINLIEKIIPDFLVKGSDWDLDNIVGKDVVLANGGEVKTIDFIHRQSTSNIIKTILEKYR